MDTREQPIRMIAADVDGTLLNSEGLVTPRTMAAILAAQNAGIVFVICTGRFFENASILARDLGLEGPLITLNGGKIGMRPFGEVVVSHKMPQSTAMEIFHRLEAIGAYYFLFADGLVVVRKRGERHHSQLDFGKRMQKEAFTHYRYGRQAALDAIAQGIYKYYVYVPRGGPEDLEPIKKQLDGVKGVQVTQSSVHNLEIMPTHVDKENGVIALAQALDIPMSQVMTIGDQLNDLSMIRAAGYGIAMGNAVDAVKAEAYAVTASNDQDGVALAIERYALSAASGQG